MKALRRRVVSAGGVVLKGCRRPRVLLIAGKYRRVWALPKGRVEPGERHKETAVREVKEETGIEAAVIRDLGSVRYYFTVHEEEGQVRISKTVHYYLMRYRGGEPRPQLEEVDDARWVDARRAVGMLTYENERKVLERALHHWRERCKKRSSPTSTS